MDSLTGYFGGAAQFGGNPYESPPAGQSDPTGRYQWNPYTQQWVDSNPEANQFGDPTMGTDVYYGVNGANGLGGPSEHFAYDPSAPPVTSFLSAGSNYANTGGIKSTNDPALISSLNADSRTRSNQSILQMLALAAGGASLAGAAPWSAAGAGTQYGTGVASASDAAYGSVAGGGTDVLGAGGLFGAGGAPSTLAGLGGGGGTALNAGLAGAVNAGTAGLGTFGGIGAGVGAGLGAGSMPAAGAGVEAAGGPTTTGLLGQTVPASGWGPAMGTVGGAPSVAAAGGMAGALGSLGLPGWLTIGSLAAGALQGNKDQTSTTTNAPPAYIAPYLADAAAAAQQQYGQGAYVSPLQQAAVGYGTNVLNGSYLNSNPYLDATFNKAAGAVTNQVQSNFGVAGRNPRGPDAAGLATDKYSELATQIYGQNYQDERNRQQQILPMTNQLGTIGNPTTALDDYIARLRNISGGYGSKTSSTPTQSNLYSGLAGLGLALIPGG